MLTAGKHYAFAYGGNCTGSLVFYYGGGVTIDTDFGLVVGYVGQPYGGPGFTGGITYYGGKQPKRFDRTVPHPACRLGLHHRGGVHRCRR